MRDNRIDLIRGFAMVTICVNHITWMLGKVESVSLKIPTLTHYGYSSAAEIFFLAMFGLTVVESKRACFR